MCVSTHQLMGNWLVSAMSTSARAPLWMCLHTFWAHPWADPLGHTVTHSNHLGSSTVALPFTSLPLRV